MAELINDEFKNDGIALFADKIKALFAQNEYSPKAYVHSFGCQQNVSDGEKIKGILNRAGYEFTDTLENADLVLYNTCAVRESAELKVLGMIGELKHLKEEKPGMVIALCGCMAQQEHIPEKIKKSYPQVDIVFGTFAVGELLEFLYRVLTQKQRVFDISEHNNTIFENYEQVRENKFKASVPIMYGCNNFCTYCIVPYVRGRERSRDPKDILAEIKLLIADGYKEIMLLGQNVNSYGKGLEKECSFSELLCMINDIDGDFKIRFMSSHPKDATKELIDTILGCEKVAKHLHLPIQSGSDDVLRRMNRQYDSRKYLEIVKYARSISPEFSFSTDIIVGFPNESDGDFEDTLKIMREVRFDNVFSFIYSRRSGTKAAEMEDIITYKQKSERMGKLLSLQREVATSNYKRFVGRTVTVLVDGLSKKGMLTGKNDEFIIVEFEADEKLIGSYVEVSITDVHNWALVGKLI